MFSESEITVIILSGFIGSLIVLLTTFFASKYGSISGVITTIPTNTLVSLLGISINIDDIELLQKDIYISIILCYCAFIYLLIFWIYLPEKIAEQHFPIIKTCFFGIGIYSLISYLSYQYLILYLNDILSNKDFLILSILVIFKYYYFSSIHKFIYKFKEENIQEKEIDKKEIIIRFISSFSVISLIVFIGKINQVLGVIMSSFPLLSIMNSIILWNDTNNPILISQLNSNILIGGTAIYMYILSFAFFLGIVELYLNVIISLSITITIYNYPIYFFLKKINNKDTKKNIRITMV